MLSAQTIAPQEVEPNGTFGTATAITTNPAKIRGYIYPVPVADEDYYSFTATAGDKVYAAVMTSFSASASVDAQLRLFDSDGTTILENDDNDGTFGTTAPTIAGATIPSTGTYYLQVKHMVATGHLRPYDLYLQVKSGSPTAEVESNNTSATANVLPGSGWVSGTRDPAGDVDFFSLTLAAGETVFLSLDLDPERDNVQWDGRLGFAFFGNANDQILFANDASAGSVANPLSEAFFFTVKDAGTYYVTVDALAAGTGDPTATYNLSVSRFLPTTGYVNYASTDVPQAIPSGPGLVSSTLTIADSKLIKDLSVRINLDHMFMQDLDVILTAPNGAQVALFTDIGAATVGGSETTMDFLINDNCAIPPLFPLTTPLAVTPELNAFLDYFKGVDIQGTWTLTIRDDAAADAGILNSWSLEVLEDDTPTIVAGYNTVFSTDFESDDAGFTHSGTADEWERGTPSFAPITTANSGVNCWKTDLDDSYNASSDQLLESGNIDLTALTGSIIASWAMKYHLESATFDRLEVYVEDVFNPSNTQLLFRWYGATMNSTVGASPSVTVPLAGGWGTHFGDISAFAGNIVRFKVRLTTDVTVQLAGVAIDDVKILNEPSVVCPTPPTVSFDIGGSSIASINNSAADPSESATVAVCDGGTYTLASLVHSIGTIRYMISVTPSGGGLLFNGAPAGNGDISAAQFTLAQGIYTVTLSNPAIGGTVVQVITPYEDVDGSGGFNTGDCAGDPVTITYTVNPRPRLVAHLNGVTVSSNNDGNTDTGSFSVCNNGTITISTNFSDANGLTGPPVRVYQTVATVNASVSFCNNCQALLSGFTAGTSTAVALTNPALPGTVVITFQAWQDLNNNNLIDADECTGDVIEYTITVNPRPQLVAHLNGVTVSSNNDGNTDTGSFSVCNNGTIAISTNFSDANGLTGPPVRVYQTVATVNASVSFCNNCQALLSGFTAGTSTAVVLTNPALPGTVVITFQAWQDLNNNNVIDADECTGDVIEYTVTVAPSPAITCPSPFSVNSSTDGTGNCSGTANWTHPTVAPGPCGPITLTMSIDGGNPAVVTPGGPASQVLSVGPHTITYVVSDGNTPTPNTATCSFTITVVDNEPPMVACSNQTVTFNGQNSIPLVASQLVTTTDNCGVTDTLLSITAINCIQLGQVIPVTVTAKDAAGNMSTCISNITVTGLPCGWSHNSGSVGCGSTVAFAPATGVWSASATNCYYANPYTSDAVAFAQRTLCGNGSITARVTSIGGAGGWAGVTMRETNALGAKKVQLMTNLSNFVRAEVRYTTGGQAYPADLFSFQRFWVRIMRQGNEFTGFVSSDGNFWIQTLSVLVPMNSCIQVGLVMTNFLQNGTGTATFDNVVATGSNVPPMVGGIDHAGRGESIESREQPHGFEVYPNPTNGELNVDLTQYVGRAVRLEVYSLEGKLLQFREIDEVQPAQEIINLSEYQNGMYLVKVKSIARDGISGELPDVTRRVVLTRG